MPALITLAPWPDYYGVYAEVQKRHVADSPLPLFVHDSTVFANSLDIAAAFGVTHRRLMRVVGGSFCEMHAAEEIKPTLTATPSRRHGFTYKRSFNLTGEAFLAFAESLVDRNDQILANKCLGAFEMLEARTAEHGADVIDGQRFHAVVELDAA
jgi:hypothetical protein